MWEFLLHLWAGPPVDAIIPCPAPIPGEPIDPGGLYDAAELTAVWGYMAAASAAAVLLALLVCYLAAGGSLRRSFVLRWYGTLAGVIAACALLPLLIGKVIDVQSRGGSCTTRVATFAVDIPLDLLWQRMFAGALWGGIAFVLLSLVFTQLLGRTPAAGGFFHHRGCPWPRFNPLQG